MNYWIFQAIPERYDLRETLVEGEKVIWYATRYRNQMSKGDIVFLWLGGPNDIRGVYGWGKLDSSPYIQLGRDTYGVDVIYEKRLKSHIPVEKIKSVSDLQDLLILRAPQATNFLLSHREAHAIANLMAQDQRPKVV